jgi:hypothetical protein
VAEGSLAQPFGVEEAVDTGKADVERRTTSGTRWRIIFSASIAWRASRTSMPSSSSVGHTRGAELLVVVNYQDMRLRRHG